MSFAIRKSPIKLLSFGLAGLGLYFAATVLLLRSYRYYYLFLGFGFICLAILIVRSIGAAFVSSLTVTDSSIETVTSVGGIIRVDLGDIDWERTEFSELGLKIASKDGESLFISVAEYSRQDLARLIRHIHARISGRLQSEISHDEV